MSIQYQIGQRIVSASELVSLVQSYQMVPQLLKECVIEQVLDDIELSDEEQSKAVQEYCVRNQLEDAEAQKRWLTHYQMTPNQLKALALRTHKLEKFKTETWGSKVESVFLTNKQQFDQVVYSLVRLESPEIAQELFFRLQENEAGFSEIAAKYSKGPEAQTGGLIGPVEVTKLHPKLSQSLMSSKPGQIRPPMRVDQWIVILKLERMLPASLDDGLRARLIDQQFQEWLRLQVENISIQTIEAPGAEHKETKNTPESTAVA
ncbi:MAG: peptidylprolyl isomerase [Cyanobacteria bacterium P01_F01_bin.42]